MKILHSLSQRPEATGSGIYIQALIEQAEALGFHNFLSAGIPHGDSPPLGPLSKNQTQFVTFEGGDLSYPVAGMSDVMPYKSTRFRDMSDAQITEYENTFKSHFEKLFSRFQPDIIHAHHLWLKSSVLKKHFPHIPLAISCHGSDLRQFENNPHLRDRVSEGVQQADIIFALSNTQKEDIIRWHNIDTSKVHVIGGGYNHHVFQWGNKSSEGPIQIMYSGKLSRAKGVIYLLRALQQQLHLDWHFHITGGGTGQEKDEIVKLANQMEDRVTLHGFVERDTLVDLMKQSHIFVLPSFFEGLPLVLMEALASGCRLISTTLPGVMELFQDQSDHVIERVPLPRLHSVDQPHEDDEAFFIDNLSQSLSAQINRSKQKAALERKEVATLIDSYTWPGIFKKISDIYRTVI